MAKEILIKPGLCIGCSTCSLTCSLQNRGEFRPSIAFVRVVRREFEGTFNISFSSACTGCGACAQNCPSGALSRIEINKEAG
jgi:carbon-monoxide dehydrogenase iron sulfur subunit